MLPQIQPFVTEDYPGVFTLNTSPIPKISAPGSEFSLQFAMDRDTSEDIDVFHRFLKNAIYQFRNSKTYKHYKGFLINSIGIDCCQYHGMIKIGEETEMATLEMHHHLLTIYDISAIIANHVFNSGGNLTTFDLIKLLEIEHKEYRIPTVMLCKTCHQLQHNDPSFYLNLDQVFGNWIAFLMKFHKGVTRDIWYKLYAQIKRDVKTREANEVRTKELLQVTEKLYDWSEKNEQFFGESQIDLSKGFANSERVD